MVLNDERFNGLTLDLRVNVFHPNAAKLDCLYENIKSYEDAALLAQYAMQNKNENDLIVIMPGCNQGIKNNQELFRRAKAVGEKYKFEVIR